MCIRDSEKGAVGIRPLERGDNRQLLDDALATAARADIIVAALGECAEIDVYKRQILMWNFECMMKVWLTVLYLNVRIIIKFMVSRLILPLLI